MKNVEILIVEDSLTQAENLRYILECNNYSVQHAMDAESALEMLQTQVPDIIVSDIVMPGKNGYEFCAIVKSKDRLKNITVLLLTSLSDPSDVIRGLQCKADSFIVKPFNEEFLIGRIQYFVQNAETRKNNTEITHLQFVYADQNYTLISSPRQILDILLSTYENSILKNKELFESNKNLKIAQDNLSRLNFSLERQVKVRTQELENTNAKLQEEIEERLAKEEELLQLSSKLQERNEDLDAYSHTVAHDLRGHLEVMTGYANLLYHDVEQLTKDKIQQYSHYIYQTGNTLTNVIKELLLFASMDSLDDKVTEINMKDIVTNVIEDMSGMIEKSKTEIKLPDRWPTILSYGPLVEEIWKNYISNAIKYGGTPPKIEIGCNYDNSDTNQKLVQYWIKDNGSGIKEENREIIFEKFNRLNKAKATGYGLGLSIVRRITNKLGGKSGVESAEGTGSKFYFTFPAGGEEIIPEPVSIENSEENTTQNVQIEDQNINKEKTVLIVEDTDVSFQLLEIILERSGIHIIRAKNGKEATKLCSENKNINLVLMDIHMPVMDGYEATGIIKKIRPGLPIIAITAYSLFGDRGKSHDAGCDDYLTKPIKKDEFLKKMEKYLGEKIQW